MIGAHVGSCRQQGLRCGEQRTAMFSELRTLVGGRRVVASNEQCSSGGEGGANESTKSEWRVVETRCECWLESQKEREKRGIDTGNFQKCPTHILLGRLVFQVETD